MSYLYIYLQGIIKKEPAAFVFTIGKKCLSGRCGRDWRAEATRKNRDEIRKIEAGSEKQRRTQKNNGRLEKNRDEIRKIEANSENRKRTWKKYRPA